MEIPREFRDEDEFFENSYVPYEYWYDRILEEEAEFMIDEEWIEGEEA